MCTKTTENKVVIITGLSLLCLNIIKEGSSCLQQKAILFFYVNQFPTQSSADISLQYTEDLCYQNLFFFSFNILYIAL